MRTNTGIILQARFASTRLPGKALAPIGAHPLLEHCLRRLIAAGVAHVVLATTTNAEDEQLASVAHRLGVAVFRGATEDVLGRYAAAAAAFGFEVVIRATGDNPAVDIHAPGRLLALLRTSGADYAAEVGLPLGAAVEVMTASALQRAAMAAQHTDDREHVTTYIKRNPRVFRLAHAAAPAPLCRPDLRLTVDTAEDLRYVRELFARTGANSPTLRKVIEVAGRARTEVA